MLRRSLLGWVSRISGKPSQRRIWETLGSCAFVAYQAHKRACLCELNGAVGFQPEIKQLDDLWFTSTGSGQGITDSFLALFRSVFWKTEPPDVKGGIFTVYWALKHACEVNPGGVNFPIRMAVYGQRAGILDAWMLSDDDMSETQDLVKSASEHFASFRDVLLGKTGTKRPPPAPAGGSEVEAPSARPEN